jgi:hypothetical protein
MGWMNCRARGRAELRHDKDQPMTLIAAEQSENMSRSMIVQTMYVRFLFIISRGWSGLANNGSSPAPDKRHIYPSRCITLDYIL